LFLAAARARNKEMGPARFIQVQQPQRSSDLRYPTRRLPLPLPVLQFLNTAPLLPIEHILNHRPNQRT
jgi:hypothetical protein